MLPMRKTAEAAGTCSQQFRDVRARGEYDLIRAIIAQAQDDIEYGKRKVKRKSNNGHRSASIVNARQAQAWLNEKTSFTARAWSFPWCCEVLGVDPAMMRSEIDRGELERCKKRS